MFPRPKKRPAQAQASDNRSTWEKITGKQFEPLGKRIADAYDRVGKGAGIAKKIGDAAHKAEDYVADKATNAAKSVANKVVKKAGEVVRGAQVSGKVLKGLGGSRTVNIKNSSSGSNLAPSRRQEIYNETVKQIKEVKKNDSYVEPTKAEKEKLNWQRKTINGKKIIKSID